MTGLPGRRVKLDRRIQFGRYAVRVEVEAVYPDEDPSEPCLEMETVECLEKVQRLADVGMVDELAKHGEVYVRRSA